MGRPGIRTGILLIALAVVPLVGAGWFGAAELRTASEVSTEVEATGPLTEELVRVTDLRTRLRDEYNWSTVLVGLVSVGFAPELVGQLTGIDVVSEHAAATADVDVLLAELGITEMTAKLSELRALRESATAESMREIDVVALFAEEYDALEATVVDRIDGVLDRLLTIAGGVGGGQRLVTSLRVLESAAEARQALASQLIGYFTTQFSTVVLDSLIEQQAAFERAAHELARLAPPGSRAAADLEAIRSSGDADEFVGAVTSLIDERLAGLAADEEVSLAAVVGQLDAILVRYETGSRAADAHLALVASAGEDVVDAGVGLLHDADANRTRAWAIMLSLVLVSALVSMVLTRAIVSPLRQLATSARLLKDGETDVMSESRGPLEVREAAAAIKDAAGYLQLVEHQATALARGDLRHPSLAEEAPGELGRSLQSAVRTLTASLNDGEAYRRQLAHDAAHDALTQLPNRRASLARLTEALARSRRADTRVAVLFIDLDGFKEINDLHGHQAGDFVLQTVAARMLATVRQGDHVGRFGGDEFLVIAEPADGVEGAGSLGERLIAAVQEPIDVGAAAVSVGASIGIAVHSGDGLTPDEILRNADIAVYRAKQAGRNTIAFAENDLLPTVD